MNLETCCIAFLLPSPRKPVTAHQRRLLYSPGWNFIRGGVRTDNKEKVVPPGEITVGGTRTRLTVKSWHRVAVALTWSRIKLHFGTLSFAFSFNYNGRGPDTVYYWIYRKFCRSSERRDRTSRRGLTSSSIEHARRLPCSLVRYPSSPNICFVNSAQAEVNARAIKIEVQVTSTSGCWSCWTNQSLGRTTAGTGLKYSYLMFEHFLYRSFVNIIKNEIPICTAADLIFGHHSIKFVHLGLCKL